MKSNIRTLEKNFTVNKNSIELYIEAYVDGKKIIDKKSDSLVSGFLKILYSQFGGRQSIGNLGLVSYGAISGNNGGINVTNIDSSGSPIIITTVGGASPQYIQLSGVETISGADINGVWETSSSSDGSFSLIGSSGGGEYDITGAFIQPVYPDIENFITGAITPSNPAIVVSTSTDPIEIDSWFVDNQIKHRTASSGVYPPRSLQAGDITISQPFVEDETSLFTISQTFFNGTDETINVRKAGLYGQVGAYGSSSPNNQAVLLAEDFITSDLAPTETLSVNYKIVNSVTPDGGILSQFTRFYHSFLSGQRDGLAIPMISGSLFNQYPTSTTPVPPNTYRSDYPMVAASMGHVNGLPIASQSNDYQGWRIGPTLGNAIRTVKSTDYTLLNASDEDSTIVHGDEEGQLYYFGSVVGSWSEDTEQGTAQFTISRFFQNKSDNPVNIRQIGLNTGFHSWSNNQLTNRYFCISSNTLSSDEVFAPGEYGLVNVTLSIEV